jgi:hypothetical protein
MLLIQQGSGERMAFLVKDAESNWIYKQGKKSVP